MYDICVRVCWCVGDSGTVLFGVGDSGTVLFGVGDSGTVLLVWVTVALCCWCG